MNMNPLRPTILLTMVLFAMLMPNITTLANKNSAANLFYSINYRTGQNRPHRENIKNLNYYYRGGEIKLGWQSFGATQWQHAYRFPSLGIGFNWNSFDNETLGNPAALYFFTAFPQLRWGIFRLDMEVNLGAAYGFNPYHPIENPNNGAIGSKASAYFGFFLEQSVRVTPHIELFISEGLTHYSNATLSYPNTGLNILMIKAGVKYQPQATPFESRTMPKVARDWSLGFNHFFGSKKLKAPTPTYYQYGIMASLNKRISYKNRVSIGYEAAYNQATQAMYWDRTLTAPELISHAWFVGHEFLIDRFSITTLFGLYTKNRSTDKVYYERLAIGYEVLPRTRIMLQLKAHKVKAEYLEFGIAHQVMFR